MQAHSSYGFCAGNSPMAGSIGFGCEVAPTLRSGQSGTNMVPTVIYDVIVIDRAAFNQGASFKFVCTSNGRDVIETLCARDYKGIGSQYVGEGKVLLFERATSGESDE